MAERVIDRGSLETTMCHAVVAARIAAHAVHVPRCIFHQRAKARRIALIGKQIARPLPAKYVVGRIAPGRALIGLVSREEIQEQRRMIELPRARFMRTALFEDIAEQLFAGTAAEEYALIRRVLIAESRRNSNAFDTERHRLVEELGDFLRVFAN